MGIESFDNLHIVNKNDIAKLKATEKEKKFFERVFDKMDTDNDGKLDDIKEGAICIFEDGAISAMKTKSVTDSKIESIFIAGRSSDGTLVEAKEDNSREYTYTNGSSQVVDANGKVKSGRMANGTTFKNITDKNGTLLYKEYVTSDGSKYLLSTDNKKFAKVDPDGGIHTSPVEGDSFDGTMMRLGIKDPKQIQIMRDANKQAFINKHNYFTIHWDVDLGDVYIPPEIAKTLDLRDVLADNHKVGDLIDKINKPAEPHQEEQYGVQNQPQDNLQANGNDERRRALESYAEAVRNSGWQQQSAQPEVTASSKEIDNPKTDVKPEVKLDSKETKAAKKQAKALRKAQKRERKEQARAEALAAKEQKKAQKRAEKDAKAAEKAQARAAAAAAADKATAKHEAASAQYTIGDNLKEKIKSMTPLDIAKCKAKTVKHDAESNRHFIGEFSGISQDTAYLAYNGTKDWLMSNHAKYKQLLGKADISQEESDFISGYETRFCKFLNASE